MAGGGAGEARRELDSHPETPTLRGRLHWNHFLYRSEKTQVFIRKKKGANPSDAGGFGSKY